MPRVKPLTRQDPRETAILEEIGAAMMVTKMTQKELAEQIGMHPSTMSRKLKHVGDMRLSELWAIQDVRKKRGV